MWEWFIPARDRHLYTSQMMEGPHGSFGPLDPKVVGWMWGFLIGAAIVGVVMGIILWRAL